jgi:CRISPR-associated Csh1 family protein
MIRTIYQFGQHLRDVEDMKPYFEIAAAPYSEKGTEDVVIVAEIRDRRFQKITIETYRKSLVSKYLYRELASSNSTSLVPTLYFYRDEDKINSKSGVNKLTESCEKFLSKFKRCVEANKVLYEKYFDAEKLQIGLSNHFETFVRERFSEKKNYLFTLQIDEKWLGEIPDIADILEKTSYDKYFRDSKGELFLGRGKTCAVTYQQNVPEVWGRVDTLGFTVNDIAFSRNGFEAKESYKMFPVSPDAVRVLEGTMRALDKQLSLNFAGLKFIVLPHFVTLGDDVARKKNIVRRFVSAITTQEIGFDILLNSIVNSESIFSNIIEDPELGQNSIYYDIFFYEEKQAQFAIKLHVSDVVPSRFRKIREAKRMITNFYRLVTFKQFKNNDTFTFSPSFYNIKDYFAIKREKETIIEPYFFKVVEAIFHKNRLDEEQVLRAFMHKIVPAFKNTSNSSFAFTDHVKHSFCIHRFFQKLQLFGNMEPPIEGVIALSSLEFVKQHETFFKNRLQKAAFLLGCAVEVLLGSQRSNLNGNEPFSKRLNNLSVDYRELQRIKTELLSKVKQYADANKLYDGDYIHQMLVEFDQLMLGGDDPNLSKTQVSYAFSVGLVMEKEFTRHRIAGYKAQSEAKKKARAEQSQEA